MNVLHVIPRVDPEFGGPPVALVGYVQAAEIAGYRSTIVALGAGDHAVDWMTARLSGVVIHAPAGRIAVWRALETLVARADLVHVHGTLNPVSSFGMWRAIRAGRPVVVRPFGTLSRYTFSRRRRALKRVYHAVLDGPALRRAAAVHFTSETERDESLRLPALNGARCFVVPPPWTGDDPASPPRRSSRDGSEETVLFLSRLDPKKGLEALLDAWPELARRRPLARLVVAGDGAPRYRAALQARAAGMGVGDRVQFAGFVTGRAKQALLARADLLVLPSTHENFGVAVIDALASGVPVVVSAGVGLADFVRDRGLGRVAALDPDSLAGAIDDVLADSALRTRCARDGPAAVASTFGPDVIAQSLGGMYQAALAAKSLR